MQHFLSLIASLNTDYLPTAQRLQSNSCANIDDVLLNDHDWTVTLDFQIIVGSLYAAIFAFGLISNVFVVVAIIRSKTLLGDFHNEFIGNLAVADLFLCLISLPLTAYIDFYKVWPLGHIACRIFPFVQGLCVLLSSFTLSMIAIDRYFRIVKRKTMGHRTCVAVVLIIWGVSGIISTPLAMSNDLKPGSQFHDPPLCGMYCTESEWQSSIYRKAYGTSLLIAQFVVPLVIITCSYSFIAFYVDARSTKFQRRISKLSPTPSRRKSIKRRKQTSRMLIAMILVFVAASAPLSLINILTDYDVVPEFLKRQQYFVSAMGHLLYNFATAIDPILYVIMNKPFRRRVLRAFRCQIRELKTSDRFGFCEDATTSPAKATTTKVKKISGEVPTFRDHIEIGLPVKHISRRSYFIVD